MIFPKRMARGIKRRFFSLVRGGTQPPTGPYSDCFPYQLHDLAALPYPPDIEGDAYLVGKAWVARPDAPIALGIGFSNWKLGFIAAYLPQARMAFLPKAGPDIDMARLEEYRAHLKAIYVWGYNAPDIVEGFARENDIPFYRIEDGFLRSTALGSAHSVPYSLVITDRDLHFNACTHTGLDAILNEMPPLTKDQEAQAEKLRAILVDHSLSKYNSPTKTKTAPKIKGNARKILVIGQVDTDAAIRLANPDHWKIDQLTKLAAAENPEAEIYYRPHPDVYEGFQKSAYTLDDITSHALLLAPDTPLFEVLDHMDHVYTMTSLAGLEAVMRGLKVTTVGLPFYAGRGVTDDRAAAHIGSPRRTMTLNALLYGIYLRYPTYIFCTDDPWIGFLATTLRIRAERNLKNKRLAGMTQPQLVREYEILCQTTAQSGIDKFAENIIVFHHLAPEKASSVWQDYRTRAAVNQETQKIIDILLNTDIPFDGS